MSDFLRRKQGKVPLESQKTLLGLFLFGREKIILREKKMIAFQLAQRFIIAQHREGKQETNTLKNGKARKRQNDCIKRDV